MHLAHRYDLTISHHGPGHASIASRRQRELGQTSWKSLWIGGDFFFLTNIESLLNEHFKTSFRFAEQLGRKYSLSMSLIPSHTTSLQCNQQPSCISISFNCWTHAQGSLTEVLCFHSSLLLVLYYSMGLTSAGVVYDPHMTLCRRVTWPKNPSGFPFGFSLLSSQPTNTTRTLACLYNFAFS